MLKNETEFRLCELGSFLIIVFGRYCFEQTRYIRFEFIRAGHDELLALPTYRLLLSSSPLSDTQIVPGAVKFDVLLIFGCYINKDLTGLLCLIGGHWLY